MQEQWTIATTVFHTIVGDKATLEAKKEEILKTFHEAVESGLDMITDQTDNQVVSGVVCIETTVTDSEVNATTSI